MAISDVVSEQAPGSVAESRQSYQFGTVLVDGCLLALPVVTILWIFLLPEGVKEGLVLAYRQPTLRTAVAAHFVHFTRSHLLANLLGYVVIVPTAYAFSLLSGRRREFLVAVAVILFAFPLVLSWLNVQLVRPRIGYGFSGVLLALAGLLTLSLGWLIADRMAIGFTDRHTPLLFFGGTAVIVTRGLPRTDLLVGAMLFVGVGLVLYAGELSTRVLSRLQRLEPSMIDTDDAMLMVGGLGLVLTLPVAAFPTEAVNGHSVVNLYIHFLGYSLGFITPFGTFQLAAWLDQRPLR